MSTTTTKRKPATKLIYVIQGHFGYGWEDESEYERGQMREARKDLQEYRMACPQGPHRIIRRRVAND